MRTSLQTENAPLRAVALGDPRLSNRSRDAEEELSGFLKITPRAMVKRRSWVSIAVCPSLPHLSHTIETSNISRIKCVRYIFIKKCVRSFIELHKSWVYNRHSWGILVFLQRCSQCILRHPPTEPVLTVNIHRS